MNEIKREKEKLRGHYLKKRQSISHQEAKDKSQKIVEHLIRSEEFIRASTVHCYVSIDHQNEVNTISFIEQMIELGKHVVVPRIEDGRNLSHWKIKSLSELKENKWGVAEPVQDDSNKAKIDDIELVIVPMIAGDQYRNRLGYGKGFYDRFLKEVRATKMGILYEFQVHPERLATEEHDVVLDYLMTENGQI